MLSSNEISELREFIQARQYAVALEALCGILVDQNKHVTRSSTRGFTAWLSLWTASTLTS
jgi:hypothetical protein